MAFLEGKGLVEMSSQTHQEYALHPQVFADMVLSLFCDGCLTADEGSPSYNFRPSEAPPDPRSYVWRASARTVVKIREGMFPYTLRLTHDGRVRMARLRDELDRGRQHDQTGILVDGRHIARDLRVRMAMLGEDERIAVLAADLDNFKQVNDRHGHSQGDEALRRYFTVLRDISSSAGGDAYRRGGDETIVIVPGARIERARELAEAVRRGVELELSYLEGPTVSIGVFVAGAGKAKDILDGADRLLYQAKAEGRNRVVGNCD